MSWAQIDVLELRNISWNSGYSMFKFSPLGTVARVRFVESLSSAFEASWLDTARRRRNGSEVEP
jgi:hypothetical protein